MKKFTLFLGALLISMMSMATEVTVSIADYAAANGWENSKQYTSLTMDEVVTVTANPTTGTYNNTGKYYTNGNNWRIYQNENPKIVITAAEGHVLTSVTFTYQSDKTGVMVDAAGKQVLSGEAYSLGNVASATFSVSNTTADVTNGQARISSITVSYEAGEGGSTTPEEPETPEVTADTITCAEAVAICQETGETATSVEYTVRGYVTNIKYAWSEKFGTATFWIADTIDGGDVLQAYNCAPLKDADKVFAVGAYVELVGKLKKYGTTNEVEKGTYTVITPAEGGQTPDDGGETPVDTITVAAGLALTDNATCVLNPFTVIYVSGAYVYIEDESAYALLYQYESGLKAGDQVSGMEVTKTTYQDIAQFKPTTMENLTIVAGTAPAIDEITTAPTVADNHLVKLMNVTLAGAIAAGKTVVATCNDNTTINIYSKFDFTIEEGKSYNIIGGVTQYNGTIQIQAYEVEETIGAPSAIDNITINQNATKFIENGQLIIVKNGVRYNALGQVTK